MVNFYKNPHAHLRGQDCPKCVGRISKKEIEWLNKIEGDKNIKLIRQHTIFSNGNKYDVDGFHKESNTVYEYFGNFWHGNPDVFNKDEINPIVKITYGELYRKTLDKINNLHLGGYNVIYKWED